MIKSTRKIDKPIVFKYFYTGSESRLNAGPGVTVHGIETSVFIEILRSILKAKLTQTQEFLGDRAQAMLIGVANTTLDTILYQESGFWEAVEGHSPITSATSCVPWRCPIPWSNGR